MLELNQDILDGPRALVVLHQPGDDQRGCLAVRFGKLRGGESDKAVDGAEIGGSAGPKVVACAVELRLVQSMSFIEHLRFEGEGIQAEEAVVGAEPQHARFVLKSAIDGGGGQSVFRAEKEEVPVAFRPPDEPAGGSGNPRVAEAIREPVVALGDLRGQGVDLMPGSPLVVLFRNPPVDAR